MEELIEVLKHEFDTNQVEYDPDNGYYVDGKQLEIVKYDTDPYLEELNYYLDEYIDDLKRDLMGSDFCDIINYIDWQSFKTQFDLSDFGWETIDYKDNTYYYLNY